MRRLQLAISADHQLLGEVVLLLLLRHFGMQYRARVIADRGGLSCNLIRSISRPRWTLNIAENGVAFCGGAEASSVNHLMILAWPPCLVLDFALACFAAVILRLDERQAFSVLRVACVIGFGLRLVDTIVQHISPAQPRSDVCSIFLIRFGINADDALLLLRSVSLS